MKVLARIELLATGDGGRKEPLAGNFRLNHSFEPGEFVVGQVEQQPGDALAPGQSAALVVDFLPDAAPNSLASGMEWRIYDGPKHLVGRATVLEVLSR